MYYHINLHNNHNIEVGTIIIFNLKVSIISAWGKKENRVYFFNNRPELAEGKKMKF